MGSVDIEIDQKHAGLGTRTPHYQMLYITQSVFSPATRPLAARLSAGF
jgi:hypothetical protein